MGVVSTGSTQRLRSGWACLLRQAQHNACGGFWVSAGVSVGESRPRILSANKRMDDVQMAVASEWAGLSLRRIMGFGGRVRGVGQLTLSRTHGRERMDGAQMGVASDWVGLSLRGFWVSAGVSVGEAVHE